MTRKANLLVLYFVIGGLCFSMGGCSKKPANATFTIRVSGPPEVSFEGQCSSLGTDDVTREVDLHGVFTAEDETFEFEVEGIQIYCAVTRESSDGTLTLELLKDGVVVDRSQTRKMYGDITVGYSESGAD